MAQKKLHRKGERHIFVWTVSEHDHTLLGLFFFILSLLQDHDTSWRALLQKKIKWIAVAAAADLLHSLLLQQPHFFISYSSHFHVSFFF